MGIALSGIFSGIDSETIISQLIAADSRPLQLLQTRKTKEQGKQTAVADLESRLTNLRSLVDNLRDSNKLRAVAATTSDSDILTVSASTGAGEGSHSIVINQLATAQRRIQSTGLSSLDLKVGSSRSSAVNANTVADADATWFTTSANGATYTLDFGSEADLTGVTFAASTSYSMNQVAALINARSQAVAGYDAASVVLDNGQYKLTLTAKGYGPVGSMTQTLTAGDAVAELNDEPDWTKTNGATGALTYTYKGVTRTLNTTTGTTLAGLRDLINNDGSNPGVTASTLLYDGAYHLVLGAKDTGTDNVITINDAQTTLAGFASADIPVTQEAQNAKVRVDGYPSGSWIERDSNVIDDVIPGVTLNLRSTGTAGVTLARNTSDLAQNLNNLVAVYNGLVDKIKGYTGYDDKTKKGGVFQGDATVRSLMGQVRTALVTMPAGFASGEDPYTLAGQIGLEFDKTGKLSLDQTKLDDALSSNYLGVLSLVGALGTGTSTSSYVQFGSASTATTAGTYDVEVNFKADGSISTARIRGQGEVAWRFLNIDGSTLTGQTGNAEGGLALSAVSDGTPGEHTQTATVRVRRGLAGVIYDYADSALDPTSGRIANKKTQLQSSLDAVQRNIDAQQKRLDNEQTRLRAQYARLEATLSQLESWRSAYQALFNQLTTSSTSNTGTSSYSMNR